jgi:hypothetical protein
MLLEDDFIYKIKSSIIVCNIPIEKDKLHKIMYSEKYIYALLLKTKNLCIWLDIYLITLLLYNKSLCSICFIIPIIIPIMY